jgi:hypothetical protein
LRTKDAPGSTLTRIAMADRHADWLSRDYCRELPAAAGRDSMCHGQASASWQTASMLCPSGPITKAA